jgi:hypothetical protein
LANGLYLNRALDVVPFSSIEHWILFELELLLALWRSCPPPSLVYLVWGEEYVCRIREANYVNQTDAHFEVWTRAGKPEKRDAKMQIICILIYLFHHVFSNAEKFWCKSLKKIDAYHHRHRHDQFSVPIPTAAPSI